ncbi:MAG: MerR family transcriptional regulator [Aestuariivirgaceae bacterium]|nr:MerR family transcriptional regulator [Aestuariivirgaceae bacterium]
MPQTSDLYQMIRETPAAHSLENNQPLTFIGELARKFSLSPQTIRFYEDEGLISPGRFGRFRIYTAQDEHRVHVIVECRRMGLPILLIRQILNQATDGEDRAHASAIADICTAHLEDLKARLAALCGEIEATETAIAAMRAAEKAHKGNGAG